MLTNEQQRIQAQRRQRELEQHRERAAPDAGQRAAPAGVKRLAHGEHVYGTGRVDKDERGGEKG